MQNDINEILTAIKVYTGPTDDLILTRKEISVYTKGLDMVFPASAYAQCKVDAGDVCRSRGIVPKNTKYVYDLSLLEDCGESVTAQVTPPTPVTVETVTEPVKLNSEGLIEVSANKIIAHKHNELVPTVDPLYVKASNFSVVLKIINSSRFFPVFISGMSGTGKTMMVDQACAAAKRPIVRVNITVESDEDSLMGGYRLIGGETVWQDGPVVEAMHAGAVLLLDEIDLGCDKIMCLQSILEGKSYFIKKTGRLIKPAKGFQIFLTGNTKGEGNVTGKFIGTRPMNDAMLDRVKVFINQEFPSSALEQKILTRLFESFEPVDSKDNEFIKALTTWGSAIREAYTTGSIDNVISTRRLCSIGESYMLFNKNPGKAVKMGISRFNSADSAAMLTFFKALYNISDGAAKTESERPAEL